MGNWVNAFSYRATASYDGFSKKRLSRNILFAEAVHPRGVLWQVKSDNQTGLGFSIGGLQASAGWDVRYTLWEDSKGVTQVGHGCALRKGLPLKESVCKNGQSESDAAPVLPDERGRSRIVPVQPRETNGEPPRIKKQPRCR